MSHVEIGPLSAYNSLTDRHLTGYFCNARKRRHLFRAGLITRNGQIISETTYRLSMARKEHKKYVKDMLAQAIVRKTLDLERQRQSDIRKKLEEISKIELVQRVKAGNQVHEFNGSVSWHEPQTPRPPEYIPVYKAPYDRTADVFCDSDANDYDRTDYGRYDRKYPTYLSSRHPRDHEPLPLLSPQGSRTTPVHSSRSSLTSEITSSNDSRQDKHKHESERLGESGDTRHSPRYRRSKKNREYIELDSRHLTNLDSVSLRKYASEISQQERGYGVISPYLMPQLSAHFPSPPKTPHPPHVSRSYPNSARSNRTRSLFTDNKSDTDAIKGSLMIHRPEPAMMNQEKVQSMATVTMKYLGKRLVLPRDQICPYQNVCIEQQHCGGNTLAVFHEKLLPGTTFKFISRRHRGYPFSLSLYIDFVLDCRVSACCEFKHTAGTKLGGKAGHFILVGVEGSEPCFRCRVEKEMRTKKKKKEKAEREAAKKRDALINDEVVTAVADEKKDGDKVDSDDDMEKIIVPVEESDGEETHTESHHATVEVTNDSDKYDDDDFDESNDERSTNKSSDKSSDESDSDVDDKGKKKTKDDISSDSDSDDSKSGSSGSDSDSSSRTVTPDIKGKADNTSSKTKKNDKTQGKTLDKDDKMQGKSSDKNDKMQGKPSDKNDKTQGKSSDKNDKTQGKPSDKNDKMQGKSSDKNDKMQGKTSDKNDKTQGKPSDKNDKMQGKTSDKNDKTQGKTSDKNDKTQGKPSDKNDKTQGKLSDKNDKTQGKPSEKNDKTQGKTLNKEIGGSNENKNSEEERHVGNEVQEGKKESENVKETKLKESQENERRGSQVDMEDKIEGYSSDNEEDNETINKITSQLAVVQVHHGSDQDLTKKEDGSDVNLRGDVIGINDDSAKSEASDLGSQEISMGGLSARSDEWPLDSARTGHFDINKHLNSTKDGRDDAGAAEKSRGEGEEIGREFDIDEKRIDNGREGEYVVVKEVRVEEFDKEVEKGGEVGEQVGKEYNIGARGPREAGEVGKEVEKSDGKSDVRDKKEDSGQSSAVVMADKDEMHHKSDLKREKEEAESVHDNLDTRKYVLADVGMSMRDEQSSSDSDSEGDSDGSETDKREMETNVDVEVIADGKKNYMDGKEESDVKEKSLAKETSNLSEEDLATITEESRANSKISTTESAVTTPKTGASNSEVTEDAETTAQESDNDDDNDDPVTNQKRYLSKFHDIPGQSYEGSIGPLITNSDIIAVHNVSLNNDQVDEICRHIEKSPQLSEVTLTNGSLNNDDTLKICEAIARSPSNPKILNLSLNQIGPSGATAIVETITQKPSINYLHLYGNPLGDAGIKIITNGLRNSNNKFTFSHPLLETSRSVDSPASSDIIEAIAAERRISDEFSPPRKQTSENFNYFTSKVIDGEVNGRDMRKDKAGKSVLVVKVETNSQDLRDVLEKIPASSLINCLLEELDIGLCGVGDDGAKEIATLLASGVVIRSVSLSDNSAVTSVGWGAIGSAVRRNKSLLRLTLDNCKIGDDGLKAICDEIRDNLSLKKLDLVACNLSDIGGRKIIETLKRNTSLIDVCLMPGNDISEAILNEIINYLAMNRNFHRPYGVDV